MTFHFWSWSKILHALVAVSKTVVYFSVGENVRTFSRDHCKEQRIMVSYALSLLTASGIMTDKQMNAYEQKSQHKRRKH